LKEGNDSLLKARRFKSNDESQPKSKQNPEQKIPSIPGYILHKIKPDNIKKDLIRWRGIYNYEGRIIQADELAARTGADGDQDNGVSTKRGRDNSGAQ
jgi:hypothetical protein